MLMVTLRGHGDSSSGEPPHTVASCARDLFNHFHEKGLSKLPDVMIGIHKLYGYSGFSCHICSYIVSKVLI